MLRVECESCKAPYQVDERRIPASGLKMRCPKCGHTFVVKAGSGEPVPPPDPHARPQPGSPAPAPAAAAGNRRMQATMLGVGSGISKPPPTNSAAAKKDDNVTPVESEVGLPAAKATPAKPASSPGLPVAKPAASPPSSAGLPVAKPAGGALPRPAKSAFRGTIISAVPAPQSNEPTTTTARADADLPAVRENADLPSPRAPRAEEKATPAASNFGEIDLPSPAGNKPKSGGFEFDLPPPQANKNGASPSPGAAAPMHKPPSTATDGFGEIDLPSLGGGSNLPAVASNLPAVADALPATAQVLPSPANVLPTPANVLPTPAAPNAAPIAAPIAAPVAAATISEAPEPISVPPQIGDLGDFGELDLPPAAPAAAAPQPPPAPSPRAPSSPGFAALKPDPVPAFGDLDLGAAPPLEMASLPPARHAAPIAGAPPPAVPDLAASLGFGEVDLAVSDKASPALEADAPLHVAAMPAPEPKPIAAEEALAPAPRKTRAEAPTGSRKARRIMIGVVALAIVGGGALELTPYGAFGRLAISDTLNAGNYEQRAQEVAAAARKKMGSDLFPDARAAADQAAAARAEMPRARSLTAMAALIEYEAQLRFGQTAERLPRAKQWLAELSAQAPETKLLPVALAAQEALVGDPGKARKALDAASKRDVGDPIQADIAYARGELELAQKDAQAALAAFTKAGTLDKSARAEFGRARAMLLASDADGAKKALDETIKLSPKHVDARIERASLAWDAKDEKAALADIGAVLEGDVKAFASDQAKAHAYALRGWIHAGRGRAADARAAFDAALKLDGRNVSALVGQGEVLFNEGRITEALTRFDTAVQTDASSVLAIVSDAKAKLALERLQDAKLQLAGARGRYPKDWRVALWLGRAELALGNKPSAEKELLASLELLNPKDPEAIQPYVTLATLYAGQGKTKEAEAKLAEARAKLPDTSSLRRALGEVAASRGDFEGAVRHFRAALEKDSADLSTRFRLGVTLRRMRRIDEASAEFDKILAADKDYPGLALERGLLFEEAGDIDKALEQFQSALAKAPDDLDLQLRVGAAYTAIGRPNDAIPMLRKVLDKRPRSAEANHFLGRALFLAGGPQQTEAMRFLKTAVDLDPNRAEYHLYVGWAANNAIPAQLGLASEQIEKALALDKLLADAYWQRGVVESKQGAYDDAIADLKHALELKPTRSDAHAALGWCYEKKNDVGTAIAEYQKAIAADATKADWRFALGKLLFNRNAMGEAGKHLLFAADEGEKMDPKPGWLPEAEFLSGEVLRKTGKKAEAIERYRRFLEIAPTNSPDRKDANNALAELGSGPRPR